ncbi:MAG: hypothetical protein WEC00_07400 [Dongiaceae bacterium]
MSRADDVPARQIERIAAITLGTADMAGAVAFYEALEFASSAAATRVSAASPSATSIST